MVKSVPQFIWNLFKYHEKALIFKSRDPCKTNISSFYGLDTGYLEHFSQNQLYLPDKKLLEERLRLFMDEQALDDGGKRLWDGRIVRLDSVEKP